MAAHLQRVAGVHSVRWALVVKSNYLILPAPAFFVLKIHQRVGSELLSSYKNTSIMHTEAHHIFRASTWTI
jgi:hypothetical protein